jgi:hypothetical protein
VGQWYEVTGTFGTKRTGETVRQVAKEQYKNDYWLAIFLPGATGDGASEEKLDRG